MVIDLTLFGLAFRSMNLIRNISDLQSLPGPLYLAIKGVFDGVHLGHRAVIEPVLLQAAAEKGQGTAVVVTFDPHPIEVLSPQNAPRLLTSTQHKVLILQRDLGVNHVLAIQFDEHFAAQTGEEFVEALVKDSPSPGIELISVGKGWQFGKGRGGNVELLEKLGEIHQFYVNGVETVKVNEVPVSSTKIREAVASGDFAVARDLLGRDYTVFGTVIEGRKVGRTIGFPTANLTVHSEQLPPTGVYAVQVSGFADSWNGVANLGYRPTVAGGLEKRLLEIHLFGLDHEIYGEELEVKFVTFLRGEKKFDGIDELKAQIEADAKAARDFLSKAQ